MKNMELENLPINSNEPVKSHGSTEDEVSSRKYDDNEDLLDGSHVLTVRQVRLWRRGALAMAWISVIVLFLLGVISFVVSMTTESPATFGFGFNCVLDVCTSAVVIWRFYGSITEVYSENRERIALLFLAALFLIGSFSIIVRDIADVLDQNPPKHMSTLFVLAAVSGTVCSFLAFFKFIISKKLESKTVKSDGFSSLAGAVTGFSILISAKITSVHPNVWYLDNIVGFGVAILLLLYGITLLVGVLSRDSCTSTCCQNDSTDHNNTTQNK